MAFGDMALEEKRAWIMAAVTVAAYGAYLTVVLGRPADGPLAGTPYVAALLWSVGAAIVASIVLHIAAAALSPAEESVRDQRDREIHRFGEHVGQSFVVIGGVTALVLAMVEADPFWIANALYLAFVLAGLLGSAAKIAAYRQGLHPW
ncbi:hypothetical protein ACWEQL_05095 [Kitasatospora sp. NPDC004240]